MIYSQTPLHNGLERVSIKADGDGVMLTFLDTLWSAVLSVSFISSVSSSFFISQLLSLVHSYRDAHMQVLTTPPPPLFLQHYPLIKDFPQIFCQLFQLWIFNSRTDTQHHNSGDRALLEPTSSVSRLSVRLSAY